MQPHGFIRDMLDVKVLILYVTAQLENPVDMQTLYELCYVDDSLSYFDFCYAVPDLVNTEHLVQDHLGRYSITEKGRANGSATEDSIALSVRQRANAAVAAYNRDAQRRSLISTKIMPRDSGDYTVMLCLRDGVSTLMTLELMAPNDVQARRLERTFQKNAEAVYQQVMTAILDRAENTDA
jgi:predicted TIM-barrel fold metal-dependent hydrolase